MPTDPVLIVGSGGHAKVVIDALRMLGYADAQLLVVDENPARHGHAVLGVVVRAPSADLHGAGGWFHVAIGDCAARARAAQSYRTAGLRALSVVHPAARVAASARLGAGGFVAAGAILGPDATLEDDCIVNHNAVVDHDCRIGASCHVAPGATLGGGVALGARVLVGAGATILPGRRLGDDCVVGAGAVVLADLPRRCTAVGVPALSVARNPR